MSPTTLKNHLVARLEWDLTQELHLQICFLMLTNRIGKTFKFV